MKDISLHGSVHGGQQPITGASIQLFAIDITGLGNSNTAKPITTPLLANAVVTDANGGFDITGDYTCPSAATPVYLLGSGGNPGLGAGVNNSSISLMVLLGTCGSLSASTYIVVNELTTVAAVQALQPYLLSPYNVAAASPVAAYQLQVNAVPLAATLVNTATGAVGGMTPPPGSAVPVAQLNTLADIVATCVNSAGGSYADGTACGSLFSLATPPGGYAPGDTVTALLNILNNPTANVAGLLNLVPPSAPFQPALSTPPTRFSAALTGPVLTLTQTGGFTTSPIVGSTATGAAYTLTNTGTTPVTIGAASVLGQEATDFTLTGSTCGSVLAGGASCGYSFLFTATTSGSRQADVILPTAAANGAVTASITATANVPAYTAGGTGTFQTTYYTNYELLTNVVVNSTRNSFTYFSVNMGTTNVILPYTLYSIQVAGTNAADFTVTPTCVLGVVQTQTCLVTTSFSPTTYGLHTADIIVTSSAANSPYYLHVSANGLEPDSLDSVTFNSTSSNTGYLNTPVTYTFQNFDTDADPIASIQVSGNWLQTNNCGIVMAPEAICTITVTPKTEPYGPFSSTLGSYNGQLTVYDKLGLHVQNLSQQAYPIYAFGTGTVGQPAPVIWTLPAYVLAIAHTYYGIDGSISGSTGGSTPDFSFLSPQTGATASCPETMVNNCQLTLGESPIALGDSFAAITTGSAGTSNPSGRAYGLAVAASAPQGYFTPLTMTTVSSKTATSFTLTLNNTGPTTLSFSGLSSFVTSASGATLLSTTCSAVAPQGTCTLTLSVTPGATGFYGVPIRAIDAASGQHIFTALNLNAN